MINCESFASTLGSCAHNSVFLRDGTESIFILRAEERFSPYQLAIDQLRSLDANYIDSALSVFHKSVGPYCYIISKQLKRFFGDKFEGYSEEDFKIFLQYIKNSMIKGQPVNLNVMKAYGRVPSDFMEQLKQREDLIASYNMPPHWEKFRPTLTYQTHVHNKGWGNGWKIENEISNDLDQKLDIQAIKINYPNLKVYYSVYYSDKEGWLEEVSNGEMAGTTGKSKPIMGMKIHLDEAGTREFDILYRMHKFDNEWTSWAKNGEVIYSYGQKINAIQIKLEPKT